MTLQTSQCGFRVDSTSFASLPVQARGQGDDGGLERGPGIGEGGPGWNRAGRCDGFADNALCVSPFCEGVPDSTGLCCCDFRRNDGDVIRFRRRRDCDRVVHSRSVIEFGSDCYELAP